ncbi:MAG TPA: YdcF family protein [Bryobacteraceae bacterium]|nr:YdcF family protein [Bryobacteraceae bacterium]
MRSGPISSPLRMLGRALAILGLLQVLVAATPLTQWWTLALMGKWADPTGATLVVFGNEVHSDGMIGEVSYWRAVYAVRAWREGKFQRIILCGGPAANPVSEAMRQFVVAEGVDAGRVSVDRDSSSTRENALAAKRLVGNDPSVVLLTSDYHMFRAIRAARKAGLDAQPRPIPDLLKRTSVWYQRWDVFLTLCMESSKIAYYWARGWI